MKTFYSYAAEVIAFTYRLFFSSTVEHKCLSYYQAPDMSQSNCTRFYTESGLYSFLNKRFSSWHVLYWEPIPRGTLYPFRCCTPSLRYIYDDVIKRKHFQRQWPFVRGIHRSPVNSPHRGQWRGALMFSLICAWINGWVNNREAGDLRHHRTHYDVAVVYKVLVDCQWLPCVIQAFHSTCHFVLQCIYTYIYIWNCYPEYYYLSLCISDWIYTPPHNQTPSNL